MSFSSLRFTRVASIGVLIWTAWIPQVSQSQIATPAPAAPWPDSTPSTQRPTIPSSSAKATSSAKSESEPAVTRDNLKNSTTSKESGFVDFLVMDAADAMNEKNYPEAIKSLEAALMHSEAEGLAQDKRNYIRARFASALFANQEYANAIRVLNEVSKKTDDASFATLRAAAYHECHWHNAMMDELRTTLRQNPNNIVVRRSLAQELLITQVPSLKNANEALSLLLPLEERISEDPLYARMIAIAAAETGDFDLAVRMQKRYLQTGAKMDRTLELKGLERYENRQTAPLVPFPEFDQTKLLKNREIAEIARKSMVLVRVERKFELMEKATGISDNITIIHTHVGTVLDAFGTILVSSDTVRFPLFKELSGKNVEGTVRLIKGPSIDIYSLPNDSEEKKLIGNGSLQGFDEVTGLATLRIVSDQGMELVKFDVLKPIKFMPEYRSADPNTTKHLTRMFELSVGSSSKIAKPLLRELPPDNSQTEAYHDKTQDQPTMARLIHVPDSDGPIGTPLFNQLGECIGIRHEVGFTEPRKVAVPSQVCTRIAAVLMKQSSVPRPYFPCKIAGMLTGVDSPSMGILVLSAPSGDRTYSGLVGKTILSLDGVATPTLTEWLIASERIEAIGNPTALVEVFDSKRKATSLLTIPIKSNTPSDDSTATHSTSVEASKPIDSIALIEKASQWIVRNTDADRELLDTCIQEFDRILRDKHNVACYFGKAIAKDGKYHSLFIRDGEVFGSDLSSRAVELLGLKPTKGSIIEFDEARNRLKNKFELTNLKLNRQTDADRRPIIVVKTSLHNLGSVGQRLYLRLQFVEVNKSPILLPLNDPPTSDLTKPFSLIAVPTEKHTTGLLGGLILADVVEANGDGLEAGYKGVSNQLADYVELLDNDMTQLLQKLNQTDEPNVSDQKTTPKQKR